MRVLSLVGLLATLAVTVQSQGTATTNFYTNADCTGSAVATGSYAYGSIATLGLATIGNCAKLTGSAPQYANNTDTYLSGSSYNAAQTLGGTAVPGSWAFSLYNGSSTCAGSPIAGAFYAGTAASNSTTNSCQAVTPSTLSSPKWWVKVTSAASTATMSAVVGLVAVVASLATSL